MSDNPYNDSFEDAAGDEEMWRRKIALIHLNIFNSPCVSAGMTYETIIRFQAQKQSL